MQNGKLTSGFVIETQINRHGRSFNWPRNAINDLASSRVIHTIFETKHAKVDWNTL